MKGGIDWIYTILIFLAGCFLTYMFSQATYFDVDTKINVLELTASVSTILVGLYLGITINDNLSKKQHLINFIEPKLELVLTLSGDIRNLIEPNNSIDTTTISKNIKSLNAAVAQILKIFKAFKKEDKCIKDIDDAIDKLENKINSAPVVSNIINYVNIKSDIVDLVDDLDLKIVNAINILHNK